MATDAKQTLLRLKPVALVAGVALCSAVIVTAAWEVSHERILENERARLLASLNSVLDEESTGTAVATELSLPRIDDAGQIEQIFAMQQESRLIAWVYAFVAPQGYNGPIELLVGIRSDGTISRVRVLRHRETPGLGDVIEPEKSEWIRQFEGRSLGDPSTWALSLDGGSFDSITGATITPRAVVSAIESTLRYHSAHEQTLRNQLRTIGDPQP